MSKPWVVYAKTPLGGPAQVLEYLSRYTHKTAIGNESIKAFCPTEVTYTAMANDKGSKQRITLPRLEGHRFEARACGSPTQRGL